MLKLETKNIILHGIDEQSMIKIGISSKTPISNNKMRKIRESINSVTLQTISDEKWLELSNITNEIESNKAQKKWKLSNSLFRIAKCIMD